MKHFVYSLLLSLLFISCGPSHPLNYVKVQFEDLRWEHYYLLSTKDTAIVVSRTASTDSIEVVPIGKIRRIFFQGKTINAEWIGGASAVFIASSIVPLKNPSSTFIYLLSIPVGVYLGHLFADNWIELDPYSVETHELLHSRSRSQEEK